MAKKGKFIVLEGIDGSGKSTQAKLLHQRFCREGISPILTREPTNGPIGKLIRQILSGTQPMDQRAIANLFAADRTDHLSHPENGIHQLVKQGRTVICDRYYFSSYAYHSQYMDMDWVFAINQLNADILKPDLTIFIDVPPELCVKRIAKDRQSFDIYENTETLTKVRNFYFTSFERCSATENIAVINGDTSPELLAQSIWNAVLPLY